MGLVRFGPITGDKSVGTLSEPNLGSWPIWSVLCIGMPRTWGILGLGTETLQNDDCVCIEDC